MAKAAVQTANKLKNTTKKRPNVHAKSKSSKLKSSKLYSKKNRGQG